MEFELDLHHQMERSFVQVHQVSYLSINSLLVIMNHGLGVVPNSYSSFTPGLLLKILFYAHHPLIRFHFLSIRRLSQCFGCHDVSKTHWTYLKNKIICKLNLIEKSRPVN